MRVLIVEDNARLGELIARGLSERGFTPDLAFSLDDADAAFQSASYDALILDLGLPDGDGLHWLAARRSELDLPPVLILTARDRQGDRVAGLDTGADDYLVKPVDIDEVAARLRALLRRPGPRSPPVIEIGDLVFDVAARRARKSGTEIELTRRESALLELLMRKAGAVVHKSSIENALYHFGEPVTPNAIEAIVSRLRHKLEKAGTRKSLITVRGVGYMLTDPER